MKKVNFSLTNNAILPPLVGTSISPTACLKTIFQYWQQPKAIIIYPVSRIFFSLIYPVAV